MSRPGWLFVLSAPSGSGKTTVLSALMNGGGLRLVRSVSATTRRPRRGERRGRDYRFFSRKAFERKIAQRAFLEHARVLDHWYGTLRRPVEQALRRGRNVLLGLDIQGARQLRRSGLPLTTVFLLPPSLKVLEQRLRGRGTETAGQIRQRLKLARRELKEVRRYDYAVVNDRLEKAVQAVEAIIRAEQFRVR